ncbi:hypothetical protein WCX49_11765 [Sulfurimonas sp. HSL-1656]|uniref:hypothetical protein n=1 Tax=Thiomicrolovo subterrani TaxID=3131934 RepID=UPI0031F8AD2A
MSTPIDMNDFGGEGNVGALNTLIEAVTDGEGEPVPAQPSQEPEPQQAAQPPAEAAPAPKPAPEPTPAAPVPGADTAAILAAIQQMNERQAGFEQQMQQQAEQNKPEPTEEEQAMAELRKRLGIDDLQAENERLKQQLQQNEQTMTAQQMQAYQKQVESDINALKAEVPDFNPDLVAKELATMAKEPYMLPNGMPARDANGNIISKAAAMDNPAGWRQIWTEKFAKPAAPTPDPIVQATGADTAATSKSPMDRLKEADSTLEQGRAILDMIGGG